MYSRSSAAGPPPETKICQTCSRVMSCGDGCTKTMSFTTLLHLYKLKALFTFILLVSNATSEQNTAIYSTGFLAPPLTILLLALCCQPCTQTRTVPKCGNLQNLETYHAFTSTKRAPKADLLIYSIVQCIMYIHIFKLQLFFFAPTGAAGFPVPSDHVHVAAMPQHVVNNYRTPKIPFQRPKNADLLLRRNVLLSGRPVFDSRQRMHPIKCN